MLIKLAPECLLITAVELNYSYTLFEFKLSYKKILNGINNEKILLKITTCKQLLHSVLSGCGNVIKFKRPPSSLFCQMNEREKLFSLH
jgi:hypothetical protein